MNYKYTYTSLTRISDLKEKGFDLLTLNRTQWEICDYVVAEVVYPSNGELMVELDNGRMLEPMKGDLLVGAFGVRHATLEATGTWEKITDDGNMHLLTGAGLFGQLTSKSIFVPNLIEVRYLGHVTRQGKKVRMLDFRPSPDLKTLTKPVVLLVGTSMSAGKTTAGRIVTRILREQGRRVVGAKLTGAGRFKDILALKDAGAECVFDFVDVGFPSSIFPIKEYKEGLKVLLSLIESCRADIAVIEIGASPLEPYNGAVAIDEIRNNLSCTILCASDPYAVYGVMKSFDIIPTVVSGASTNTLAGIELIEKLCKVPAINIIETDNLPPVRNILSYCAVT
ncbi:MAG: hypothetical protein HKN67_12840 [Saprospiraceae bacterium]|nr:hypothetical protein [Saprospiraceae bacterium]